MSITASAPGKLVLLGEYAVLEGAPAISMAVNRRAIARIRTKPGAVCEALAPDILARGVPFQIGPGGTPDWLSAGSDAAKLSLVDQVLRGLAAERLGPQSGQGFALQLDTHEFFDDLGNGSNGDAASQSAKTKMKLGLGSSAALTVALATVLLAYAGHQRAAVDREHWLQRLLALHRGFQGGQGSGVDVATSLIGGIIAYQLHEGGAHQTAKAVTWPDSVQRLYVWSGRSASTPALLGVLRAWRENHSGEYTAHMSGLTEIAEAAVAALASAEGSTLIHAAAAYADGLRSLGEASGVTIYSEEHQHIAAICSAAGAVYKPCGAGGGDVGVVLALEDPERLEALRLRLREAGFESVPMAVDETGLKLEFTESEEA